MTTDTHTQPAPPQTIATFNPAFHKADPVAMATGSALGQVCRAVGHVTPAGILITKTTFLFSQSHSGPPVTCSLLPSHLFLSLLLSQLYFRMACLFFKVTVTYLLQLKCIIVVPVVLNWILYCLFILIEKIMFSKHNSFVTNITNISSRLQYCVHFYVSRFYTWHKQSLYCLFQSAGVV